MFHQLIIQLLLRNLEWNVANDSAVHILFKLRGFYVYTYRIEKLPMQ